MLLFRSAFIFVGLLILALDGWAQAVPADPWQRHFTIKNDSNITIYPIIQAPVQNNYGPNDECKPGLTPQIRTRRIIVNYQQKGAGIPSGKQVTVYLPKATPCWYDASRIIIFAANIDDFNAKLAPAIRASQATQPDTLNLHDLCEGDVCWTGTAEADYGNDAPAQLLEYTVENINLANGENFPNRNNPQGLPAIDFDVSYVDDAYLPVAMALDDGGLTNYMGSPLSFNVFNNRLTNFIDSNAGWSRYAAYAPEVWDYNIFHELVARTNRLPSGNILTENVWSHGVSGYFQVPPNSGPRACSANPACVAAGLDGNCCPNNDNVQLGCCNVLSYLIEGTEKVYNRNETAFIYSSASLRRLTNRWTRWLDRAGQPDLCANVDNIAVWPKADPAVFDRAAKRRFCNTFQRTVRYVWSEFEQTSCTDVVNPAQRDQCLTARIIGYDSKAGGQKNESVQALQRGLPWTSVAPRYQDDKFMLYWAPRTSIFNLNPYANLIHNTLDAPGAYSFSIDDRYGNFGGKGSGLLIDVGGSSILPNKDPFDPYAKFSVGLAPGWDHIELCGQQAVFPPDARTQGISYAFNFWADGKPVDTCRITVYADAAGTNYVRYNVRKVSKSVTDTYTGLKQTVLAIALNKKAGCEDLSTLKSVCAGTNLAPLDPRNGNVGYPSLAPAERPDIVVNVPPPPT